MQTLSDANERMAALSEQSVKALSDANERMSELAEKSVQALSEQSQLTEKNRHEEVMAALRLAETEQVAKAAVQVVAAVGRSCEDVVLLNDNEELVLDAEMAEAIRARTSTGSIQRIRAGVHGLSLPHHHLQLVPEGAGSRVVTGRVTDPAFQRVPNIYVEALAQQRRLDVTVRPKLRDGRLHSYEVLRATWAGD